VKLLLLVIKTAENAHTGVFPGWHWIQLM